MIKTKGIFTTTDNISNMLRTIKIYPTQVPQLAPMPDFGHRKSKLTRCSETLNIGHHGRTNAKKVPYGELASPAVVAVKRTNDVTGVNTGLFE